MRPNGSKLLLVLFLGLLADVSSVKALPLLVANEMTLKSSQKLIALRDATRASQIYSLVLPL